jgi:hypothetical protein
MTGKAFLFMYMLQKLHLLVVWIFLSCMPGESHAQSAREPLKIVRTNDFSVSGTGESTEWNKAEWLVLNAHKKRGEPYGTKVKMMWSGKGLYFLFSCEDAMISSTMNADFMDLWKEDVVEVFLHSDTSHPSYFEYEVSPRNFELPLLIANHNGELRRWMPFYYEANRKVVHKTKIEKVGERVTHWTAEFFVPYALLSPLKNNIPKKGMIWKANFYRVDYDGGEYASWLWKPVRQNFHDWERFGRIVFD